MRNHGERHTKYAVLVMVTAPTGPKPSFPAWAKMAGEECPGKPNLIPVRYASL